MCLSKANKQQNLDFKIEAVKLSLIEEMKVVVDNKLKNNKKLCFLNK